MTLHEIALLFGKGAVRTDFRAADLLGDFGSNPTIEIVPFTLDVAVEVAALGPSLRDPGDRAIVATARVHRLQLLTSDRRIIESGLVPVVV
jgi:PIN domain nuclease of toxin-antitoxin system